MKEFSIIIPVYNSANCIQSLIHATVEVMQKLNSSYEIILVDDGSVDTSWKIIKELKLQNENIIGIKLTKNYGQHNALLCGINMCKGNFIATIDDDFEHNPQNISALYKKLIQEDLDLVYAIPNKSHKSLLRSVVRMIYQKLSRNENKSAGEGSSYRLITKNLKNCLTKHQGSLFFIDEIALWHTDKLGFVNVDFLPSKKNNSAYGYSGLFTLSLRVLSLSSTMPLRLLRVLGFYISAISVLIGIYFMVRKIFNDVPIGYTSLMVTILFSTGIITAALGIIGEYLGNLIALSNNKPAYSIKEQI